MRNKSGYTILVLGFSLGLLGWTAFPVPGSGPRAENRMLAPRLNADVQARASSAFTGMYVRIRAQAQSDPASVERVPVTLDRGIGRPDSYTLVIPRLEGLAGPARDQALRYAVADIASMIVNEGASTVAVGNETVRAALEAFLAQPWRDGLTNRERAQALGNSGRAIRVVAPEALPPVSPAPVSAPTPFSTLVLNDAMAFIVGEGSAGAALDRSKDTALGLLVSTGIGAKTLVPGRDNEAFLSGEGGHIVLKLASTGPVWAGNSLEDNATAGAFVALARANWAQTRCSIADILADPEIFALLIKDLHRRAATPAGQTPAAQAAAGVNWDPEKTRAAWSEGGFALEDFFPDAGSAYVAGTFAARARALPPERRTPAQNAALDAVRQIADNLADYAAFRSFRNQDLGYTPLTKIVLAGGLATVASPADKARGVQFQTGDILIERMREHLGAAYGLDIPVYGATLGIEAPLLGAAWAAKKHWEDAHPGQTVWTVAAFDAGGQSCRAAVLDLSRPVGRQILGIARASTPSITQSAGQFAQSILNLFAEAAREARNAGEEARPLAVGFSFAGPIDPVRNVPASLTNFGPRVNEGIAQLQQLIVDISAGTVNLVPDAAAPGALDEAA